MGLFYEDIVTGNELEKVLVRNVSIPSKLKKYAKLKHIKYGYYQLVLGNPNAKSAKDNCVLYIDISTDTAESSIKNSKLSMDRYSAYVSVCYRRYFIGFEGWFIKTIPCCEVHYTKVAGILNKWLLENADYIVKCMTSSGR